MSGELRTFETRIPRFFGGATGTVDAENHGKARYKTFLSVREIVCDLKLTDIRVKLAAATQNPNQEDKGQ